jgi:hypothetical protein
MWCTAATSMPMRESPARVVGSVFGDGIERNGDVGDRAAGDRVRVDELFHAVTTVAKVDRPHDPVLVIAASIVARVDPAPLAGTVTVRVCPGMSCRLLGRSRGRQAVTIRAGCWLTWPVAGPSGGGTRR